MLRQVQATLFRVHALDRLSVRANDVHEFLRLTVADQRAALKHALRQRLVLQIVDRNLLHRRQRHTLPHLEVSQACDELVTWVFVGRLHLRLVALKLSFFEIAWRRRLVQLFALTFCASVPRRSSPGCGNFLCSFIDRSQICELLLALVQRVCRVRCRVDGYPLVDSRLGTLSMVSYELGSSRLTAGTAASEFEFQVCKHRALLWLIKLFAKSNSIFE